MSTTMFNIKKFYILPSEFIYGSQTKQQLYLYTALTDWILKPTQRVFSAQ